MIIKMDGFLTEIPIVVSIVSKHSECINTLLESEYLVMCLIKIAFNKQLCGDLNGVLDIII